MTKYEQVKQLLLNQPGIWLVTGAAGFIGSNLVEALLGMNQRVVGLDNYATGSLKNLDEVRSLVGDNRWKKFVQIEGDIRDPEMCKRSCQGVDYVLHQAALGSVPRSIADPLASHESNVTGFVNMLTAARDNGIKRFVYASSSSVYGDHPALPKVETEIGNCLSPYAVTKRANELYAETFARCYGMETIGLRYFNVFGPRQDPNGAYAAVIPKWISAMINNEPVCINGDGETTRDFCYVANVVQANILAATVQNAEAINQTYNVAVHARTSLNQLFNLLRDGLIPDYPRLTNRVPVYMDFRSGDVRHSEADISKAKGLLGYKPTHTIEEGLSEALAWYRTNLGAERQAIGAEQN
jgi:UDP-N-acetylglucosamine 4-epimerase